MRYSIIVVTHNSLEHTIKCISSIIRNTQDYELIVVDNGSKDGTVGYLESIAKERKNIKVICNEENSTYAKANNQGYMFSEGEHICFLNNDTVVNEGWLDHLADHLYNNPNLRNIGIVGPITNCSNGKQAYGYIQDPKAWYDQNRGRW